MSIPKETFLFLKYRKREKVIRMKHIIKLVFIVFVGACVMNACSSSSSTTDNSSKTKDTTTEESTENKTEDTSVPTEYRSALKKAESYSTHMHMSKQGIYDQLVSEYGEKFPAEAAQYAVDNLNADYNANALEKAKSYQENMSMSREAIYDQLTSEYGEKFTAEEAQYAVDNLQ